MEITLLLPTLSLLSALTLGKIINVTIDDTFGDPVTGRSIQYFPPNLWQRGDDCQACVAKPFPASDAWNGTWHDSSFTGQIITAEVQFNGTAVYVNCILAKNFGSEMTFFIDDGDLYNPAGTFQFSGNSDSAYQFDSTVFSRTDLPPGEHTVRLESGDKGINQSLVLLDSIIYTTDDGQGQDESASSTSSSPSGASPTPASSRSSSPNIKVIVGPLIGVVVLAGAVIAFLLFRRRRAPQSAQQSRAPVDGPVADPFLPAYGSFMQGPAHVEPFIIPPPGADRSSFAGPAALGNVGPYVARIPGRDPPASHLEAPRTEAVHGSTSDFPLGVSTLSSPPAYNEVSISAARKIESPPGTVENFAGTR